jgi:hypothetical protein
MVKKTQEEIDQEKLIDALTVERTLIDALTPPHGGFLGEKQQWWQFFQRSMWKYKETGYDIVYRNSEGEYHRLYGPAYVSEIYDVELWYKNGVLHRNGGPAVRHKDNYMWYNEGKLHNLDGPAILDKGGPKQFWIDGRKYSPKEYKKEIERMKRKGLLNE